MRAGLERDEGRCAFCCSTGLLQCLCLGMRPAARLRPASPHDTSFSGDDDTAYGRVRGNATKAAARQRQRMLHVDAVTQRASRLIAFAALQLSNERFEVLRLTEIPVNGCEADIGDLVQARQ